MAKRSTLTWQRLTTGTAGMLLWGSLAACGGPTGLLPVPEKAVPMPEPGPTVPVIPVIPATGEPPPISGGTLLITHDSATAVAADPDRDAVWLVDLLKVTVRTRVALPKGAEPGRSVEDQDGNVHVALRRGGQVVKIDPHSGTILSSRAVCAAPRGLAYDTATDNVHVACAGGELVTLKARGGDVARTLLLDRDLRDVVVKGDHLLLSRFRSAELIEVDASGGVVGRAKPRQSPTLISSTGKQSTTSPNTAWRTVGMPDGSVLMLHQRALDSTIATTMGGYGSGPCKSGIVNSAVTIFAGNGGAMNVGNGGIAVLVSMAVDVAVSADGQQVTLIAASGPLKSVGNFLPNAFNPDDNCMFPTPAPIQPLPPNAQPIAGAYDGKGNLWVQSRNPARLYGPVGTPIEFTGAEDRQSDGHLLFHTPTKGMIACASCHAEAGDDGHVWDFDTVGPRRTQTLRGGILATAPFHWDGDMTDLTTLMRQVFTGRMTGMALNNDQVTAVGAWVDAQPGLPKSTPRDPAAVTRGQTLFNDSAVGCAGCHSGTHFTNNQSLLVGTGKAFQVPSLTDVVARAPYLHTGCAATLRDRFDPACGGGDNHGKTSQLSATQIDDLVAYLETL